MATKLVYFLNSGLTTLWGC